MKVLLKYLFFLFIVTNLNAQPKINFWYGKDFKFKGKKVRLLQMGQNGVPQTWVNVLGNISESNQNLKLFYKLNGSKAIPLVIGPDSVRLHEKGDFNAEIACKNLKVGYNAIKFLLKNSKDKIIDSKTTIIDFKPNKNILKDSLVVRWGNKPIEETAQIVDGKWELIDGMVRSSTPGYDRIIAIGDSTWTNYEVKLMVIIHGQTPAFSNPAGGAAMGITMRWTGHVAWNNKQPREGWWPYGAAIWYGYEPIAEGINFILQGNEGRDIDKPLPKPWIFGEKYWVKFHAKTEGGKHNYKAKFWAINTTEPKEWDLQGSEPLNQPNHGSLLFVNHYTDASFGDVYIRRLD